MQSHQRVGTVLIGKGERIITAFRIDDRIGMYYLNVIQIQPILVSAILMDKGDINGLSRIVNQTQRMLVPT